MPSGNYLRISAEEASRSFNPCTIDFSYNGHYGISLAEACEAFQQQPERGAENLSIAYISWLRDAIIVIDVGLIPRVYSSTNLAFFV